MRLFLFSTFPKKSYYTIYLGTLARVSKQIRLTNFDPA